MAFRFYIDGQLTDAPVNEFELSTSIKRDTKTEGISITQDVQIEYNANNDLNPFEVSGYTLLLNAFESGTCNELLIDIYDEVSDTLTYHIYQGVIKVPSIQLEMQKVTVNSKVQDNSYYSYLNNNQSIEYNFLSPNSKNGVTITPATQTDVSFYSTITCVYNTVSPRKGININDAFDFLVRALSDNKVSFYSYSLQQEPVLFLFQGAAMTVANAGDPSELITSFKELFSELKKVRNVGYYIDQTDLNNPILVVEDLDMIYGGNNFYSFDDIKEMRASVNTDNIYAIIKVGSNTLADGDAAIYNFPEYISYLGFKEETYVPIGQCNFDNELDLINDYVISSNMIMDQLYGAVTTNLDKIFMVECEQSGGSWYAIQYPTWINQGQCFYNQGLNNPSKLITQNSNYQAATTNTLATGTYGFRAELGAEQSVGSFDPGSAVFSSSWTGFTTEPIIFVDENSGINYDGSGNYDNTTGIYVAPVDGNYSFSANVPIRIADCDAVNNCVTITVASSPISSPIAAGQYSAGITKQQFVGTLYLRIYTDSTLTTLISETQSTATFAGNGFYSLSNNIVANLLAGNAVVVATKLRSSLYVYNVTANVTGNPQVPWPNPDILALNNNGWSIFLAFGNCSFPQPYGTAYARPDSYFECNGMPDGVLTFGSSDPKLYRSKSYEFEYDINVTDFQLIKANPTGLYKFEKDNVERYGWVQSMKRNDWTGMTTVKLITNNAATP